MVETDMPPNFDVGKPVASIAHPTVSAFWHAPPAAARSDPRSRGGERWCASDRHKAFEGSAILQLSPCEGALPNGTFNVLIWLNAPDDPESQSGPPLNGDTT